MSVILTDLDRPLVSLPLRANYVRTADGLYVTDNEGSIGGQALLGDGSTAASFPTQLSPKGMSFDGAGDYLTIPDSADALAFPDPAPFSIEMMLSRPSLPTGGGNHIYLAKDGRGVFATPYVLLIIDDGDGTYTIYWLSINDAAASRGINADLTKAQWPLGVLCHVVALYDGTTWRLYINGAQTHSQVASGCYSVAAAGKSVYCGTDPLWGQYAPMDAKVVRIYDKALTPTQVRYLCARARAQLQIGGA